MPLSDDAWEADFRALPQPFSQAVTHDQGTVVSTADGSLLAERPIHGRPSVNDLATLLAHARRRPLDGDARRPTTSGNKNLASANLPVDRVEWTIHRRGGRP